MDYPFQSIHMNDKEIAIARIIDGAARPENEFENHTFTFLRDWIHGRSVFHIHTSGSTGDPKEIAISRDQMIASARSTAEALSLTPGQQALVCLDTRFIAGQMMLVRCLTTGMSIRAVTPSANPLRNLPPDVRIDFAAMVPYQVHSILHSGFAAKLDLIGSLIIGGAPLSAADEELLQERTTHAFVTYGMTETISHIALRRVNGKMKSSRYSALPGVSLEIDERSCLIISCPYISAKLTTNDIVRLLDPSTFEWLGRFDNVINSAGVKVHPEELEREIELLIRPMNLHGPFAISSVPDSALGEKIVLVLEGESLDNSTKEGILDIVRRGLPKFSLPKEILSLFPFPQTETGKIDRRKLRSLISRQL